MNAMLRLSFEFEKKEIAVDQYVYKLLDYRPFPADVLPAMLMFVCGEIDKLPIPDDNKYKLCARHVLDALEAS